jgi:hypothetical protein
MEINILFWDNFKMEEKMTNIEYVEIYPKIHLYKNLLPDNEKLYKIMKNSENNSNGKYFLKTWDQWSIFGTYSQAKGDHEECEYGPEYDDEKYLENRVRQAYENAINHYIKTTNFNLPEGSELVSSSFSKYKKDVVDIKSKLAMNYHTDFIKSEADMPGRKFLITCTTYINDDYDGGSVEFYITDNGDTISYKPKAGEILVFPSGEPYYHGVKNIHNGEKFFIRNFMMSAPFPGTEEWLKNQREFGAYRWSKMEMERIDKENPNNMIYVYQDKLISHDEWRNIEDSRQ